MAILMLTCPVYVPIITALGFDPLWFGVVTIMLMEVAMITPPIGMNVFVISGIATDVPLFTIYKGILPFLIADIFRVILLLFIPSIALFLPGLMTK